MLRRLLPAVEFDGGIRLEASHAVVRSVMSGAIDRAKTETDAAVLTYSLPPLPSAHPPCPASLTFCTL